MFLILAFLIIASRLLPHAPNFTAVMACTLFAAVQFRSATALFIILLSYWISDIIINNFMYHSSSGFKWASNSLAWIYIPLIINFLISKWYLKKDFEPLKLIPASLLVSCVFFLLTNLGVWQSGSLYPKDISGLVSCYLAAIPFFGNEIAGTLFFSCCLFSAFWIYETKLIKQHA
ncbi:MAG: hypothetical protein M3Q56_00490 [Bacteroidota bacterium]|nr:hypothetical protein [Bacteroidota bacterium]